MKPKFIYKKDSNESADSIKNKAKVYLDSLRDVFSSEEFFLMSFLEKQQLRGYESEAIEDFIDKNLGPKGK